VYGVMRKLSKIFISATALSIGTFGLAQSQDTAPKDAILILDASGSMWGQIDGVNKIVIAKDVVEGLVRGLPENQRLGMVAYGHRKKGDCRDIETLADIGADRDKVIKQIRGLSPKGKTPLTKSVEHAATELNYTEKAATVILVSDGLETCEADPCALAKLLEEKGLDFTVHVVGFNITEEERKGLVCIAEETGGEFLSADNAEELAGALTQVAMADFETEKSEPIAKPQTVALKATIMQNGPDIQSKLNWTVKNTETDETVFEKSNGGYVDFEVVPGDYIAEVVWTGWPHQTDRYKGNKSGSKAFTIAAAPTVVTVPVDLQIPVTLEADSEIAEGNAINVSWSGPDDLTAYIMVSSLDDGPRDGIYFTSGQKGRDAYQKAREEDGQSASDLDTDGDGDFDQDDQAKSQIGGPSIEGDYEVRYILADPRLILERVPLTVTDGNYTVSAPAEIPASSTFEVEWSGNLTPGDFVTIEKAGTTAAFTPTGRRPDLEVGKPSELTAPAEPGDYEVRYILANGYTTYAGMQHAVQAIRPVTIMDVSADIDSPATAVGGSAITIDIDEPDEDWADDMVSVIEVSASKTNQDARYGLSRIVQDDGSYQFRVPAIAGDYEIAYFLNPGSRIIARNPITITQAEATVDAPASVKIGEAFNVSYSGDAFKGDRVVICPADTPDNKMWQWGINYGFIAQDGETVGTYSESKSTKNLKPGDYEARYVTGLQNVIIARDKFTVTE